MWKSHKLIGEFEKFFSELEDSLYAKAEELFLETRHFISRMAEGAAYRITNTLSPMSC